MVLVKSRWLDAVTSDQATAPEEVVGATAYCFHVSSTGGPSGGVVALQGSLDGSSWANVLAVNFASPGQPSISWATGMPVKYLRVDLSGLSGGASPTVTVNVLAA